MFTSCYSTWAVLLRSVLPPHSCSPLLHSRHGSSTPRHCCCHSTAQSHHHSQLPTGGRLAPAGVILLPAFQRCEPCVSLPVPRCTTAATAGHSGCSVNRCRVSGSAAVSGICFLSFLWSLQKSTDFSSWPWTQPQPYSPESDVYPAWP